MEILLRLGKIKLTYFEAVEMRTNGNIDRSAISCYSCVKDSNKVPVGDHAWKPVCQSLEKEEVAKFPRDYRAPSQEEANGNEFLAIESYFHRIRRLLNALHSRLACLYKVHLVDKGMKQCHGSYQTANAEQFDTIINRKTLLHAKSDVKVSA